MFLSVSLCTLNQRKWLILFVRDTGREKGVKNRSLDVTVVSRRGGSKRWRHELGSQTSWKNDLDRRSRLSSSEDNYRLNGYKINR